MIWPRADRQHCAVHRLRNLIAKLPKSEHDRIRFNYWSALTDATSVKDGKLRLGVLIDRLLIRDTMSKTAVWTTLVGDMTTLTEGVATSRSNTSIPALSN